MENVAVQKQWNSGIGLSDKSAGLCIMCNGRGNAERRPHPFQCFLALMFRVAVWITSRAAAMASVVKQHALLVSFFPLPPFSYIPKILALKVSR